MSDRHRIFRLYDGKTYPLNIEVHAWVEEENVYLTIGFVTLTLPIEDFKYITGLMPGFENIISAKTEKERDEAVYKLRRGEELGLKILREMELSEKRAVKDLKNKIKILDKVGRQQE